MNKIFQYLGIFVATCLLLWAFPFFSVAVSAPEQVDLVIVMSDSPDPVIAGNSLTYTLSVSNNGDLQATGVVLTDTLSAGVSFKAASPGCTPGAVEVNCDLGSLDAGASADVTITVDVDPSARGSLTNVASASSIESGPTAPINEVTHINAVAVLTIDKDDGVNQVVAGDGAPHAYTITASNSGPSSATGVSVADTWPSGFTRGTVTTTRGSCSNTGAGFTCNVGILQVGEQVTITAPYTVPANTSAGVKTNTARLSYEEGGGSISVSDETTVITRADVSLDSKTDNPDPVYSSLILTYTLSVTNLGPSNASTVTLTDNLPAGTEYDDTLSTEACRSNPSGTIVTCPLGTITSGSNRQVEIIVRVTLSTPGTLHNTANVTTATTDPNPNNNAKAADTTVNVDVEKPVVAWVEPVIREEYFHANCTSDCQSVHFAVDASDDPGAGVQRVYFYRWDHVILDYVDIGDDFIYPYTWEFDPSDLPSGINQIFAEAYDFVGHISDRKRIFIIKYSETYMPILSK